MPAKSTAKNAKTPAAKATPRAESSASAGRTRATKPASKARAPSKGKAPVAKIAAEPEAPGPEPIPEPAPEATRDVPPPPAADTDVPPPTRTPPQPRASQQELSLWLILGIAGLVGGGLLPMLLASAHNSIDRVNPDVDNVRALLLPVATLGLVGLAGAVLLVPRYRLPTVAGAAGGALLLGTSLFNAFREYGGVGSGAGLSMMLLVTGFAAGITALIMLIVGATNRQERSYAAALGIIEGWLLALGLAAGLVLANLDAEARAAAAANRDTPGFELMASALLLVVSALWLRRREGRGKRLA